MNDPLKDVPAFTPSEAEGLAERLFGLRAKAHPLASERDQNFRMGTANGETFILKIVNAGEPLVESEFQTALIDHLSASGVDLAIPRLRRMADGRALAEAVGQGGRRHAVRLVSWITGKPLAEAPRIPAQLGALGGALGRLDCALRGFIHPGALRSIDWDIRQAGRSRARLDHILDPADRTLAERFTQHFEHEVAPRLARLRAQVIHNDANDWNVLVDDNAPAKIAGIIDFGDALHSPLIAEVAIAAAYSILESEDPIGDAGKLAAGFHAEYPLLEEEIDLLFDLIAMRLVTSVTLSAARRAEVEGNPYLAVSEAPAWRLLRRLGAMNRRFATAILRNACGFEAFPGAHAITNWIAKNRSTLAAIVHPHPATMTKDLIPYGDPAHPMTVASAEEKPDEATAIWDQYCAENGIALGIGPFAEKRTVYSGDMFRSRFVEGERRVHHLGLDLFMPAGTRLYTPLEAIVKSVEIERDPLGYGALVALEHHPDGCPPFVTLWGHMAHEVAGRLKAGDRIRAGDLVGEMGVPAENGGWAPHLHLQISCDTGLAAADILGVGEARYLDVWAELFPDAADLAGIPPEFFHQSGRSRAEIVAARKKVLLPNLSISYSEPIKFVRGEGAWLIDDRGRAYLDCFNNVCHLGHAHPDVVEAIARQARRLNTNTRYLHDTIVTYAERLTGTLPGELSVAAFACTGSEANSLALRMARAHTGRDEAVVLDWGYHGTTPELIALSPYKYKRKGGAGRPPHVFEAAIPDSYHAPADWPVAEHAGRFAQSVAEAIERMRAEGRSPGLFIAESIPSVAGQVFLPEGYLSQVYAMIRAAGGICIADEVQVGFGRVGTHWWAFETQGVTPDIVTMGKPIGNGHPMSALVTTREIAASFNNGMEYFNTFGGNPVSCAAGLAVLDVIERDGLRENAAVIGAYLLEGFRQMQARHAVIGDVRGMGLFLGIELVLDRKSKIPATDVARRVADGARERGVLMGTEGPYDNVLKMRPPMIFSRLNADHLLAVLEESLAAALR